MSSRQLPLPPRSRCRGSPRSRRHPDRPKKKLSRRPPTLSTALVTASLRAVPPSDWTPLTPAAVSEASIRNLDIAYTPKGLVF
jgi:hypothetical protein